MTTLTGVRGFTEPRETSVAIAPPCAYCGGLHAGTCPKVKSIDYYENGAVKRVEFRGGA